MVVKVKPSRKHSKECLHAADIELALRELQTVSQRFFEKLYVRQRICTC